MSPDERKQALAIPEGLALARRLFQSGERNAEAMSSAVQQLLRAAGIDRFDYVTFVDPETLEPLKLVETTAAVLVAVHVGNTRLIDNTILGQPGIDGSL